MLWALPSLRSILTPPDPDALLKAQIAEAVRKHRARADLALAHREAVNARLSAGGMR